MLRVASLVLISLSTIQSSPLIPKTPILELKDGPLIPKTRLFELPLNKSEFRQASECVPVSFPILTQNQVTLTDVSEEDEPAVCGPNQVGTGGKCTGSDCDNFHWRCSDVTDAQGGSYEVVNVGQFGHKVSEEYAPIICPNDGVAVVVKCVDDLCDDMYIKCGNLKSKTTGANVIVSSVEGAGCRYTEFFTDNGSEGQNCNADEVVKGIKCEAERCDKVYLYCCQVKVEQTCPQNVTLTAVTTSFNISNNTYVIEDEYFRIGLKSADERAYYISGIFKAIVGMLKSESMRLKLRQTKPVYLVGESARDFSELAPIISQPRSDGRDIGDVAGFVAHAPTPSFITIKLEACLEGYDEEDVVAHEFFHTLHIFALDAELFEKIAVLYRQYNVVNENYLTEAVYAFSNEFEFFATMAQIYTRSTIRLDVGSTGNLDYEGLRIYLPEIFSLLESLFDTSTDALRRAQCWMQCGFKKDLCE